MKHRSFFLIRRRIAAALLATGTLGCALAVPVPAAAQFYGPPVMHEDAVVQRLRQQGFRRLSQPTLNGAVYYLNAIDPRGVAVRLIANATDGRILAVHPQRDTRWTRIDPEDEDDWSDRRGRHRNRWADDEDWPRNRWRERRHEHWQEQHSRLPDGDWSDDNRNRTDPSDPWLTQPRSRIPDIDNNEALPPAPGRGAPPAQNASPRSTAKRSPERITVAPLPPPAAAQDPNAHTPTLKNPTIVKRSPTAIPRNPGEEKPREQAKKPTTETSKTKAGVGTRQNPRVIDMTPKAPAQAAQPPATPSPAPKTAATPQPKPTQNMPTPVMPPPAVLDAPAVAPQSQTPSVPPAPLE